MTEITRRTFLTLLAAIPTFWRHKHTFWRHKHTLSAEMTSAVDNVPPVGPVVKGNLLSYDNNCPTNMYYIVNPKRFM